MLNGSEFLTHDPYNTAVKYCIKTFGYMRNSYTGVYPSDIETAEALQGVAIVSKSEVVKMAAHYNLETKQIHNYFRHIMTDEESKYKIVEYMDEVVILGSENHAYLFDIKTGKYFAQYYYYPEN